MRIFGGTTRAQLIVLGAVLTVLGLVGAFGVMLMPNENPASLIDNNVKDKYYNGVAVWAMMGLFLIAIAGLLMLGAATTGLPLVHAAKYHMGVFYVTVFSLLLVPAAMAMRFGGHLVANASSDTAFAEGLMEETFSSPAGWIALAIGLIVMAISLMVILVNLLSLARVSYRPSIVRGGTLMGVVLVAVIIIAMTVLPFVTAVNFDHELGLQKAVGFEAFQPKDVTLTQGWLKWLADTEASSTYGNMSFWLGMMAWFLFFALIAAIVGFIGMALYSANDRKPYVTALSIMPIGSIAFAVLGFFACIGFNGALENVMERQNISSDVTKIAYEAGSMWLGLVVLIAIIAVAAFYAVSTRDWLRGMLGGKGAVDPISMESLVDPPTGLPPPPTGWPPRWDKMSNGNYIVVGLVAVMIIFGLPSGYYMKRGEETESGFNTGRDVTVIDLAKLPDQEHSFTWNDYAAEGASRPILWQPDGVWFIKEMILVVTWTDEEPFFWHENQPDIFEVRIFSSTGEEVVAQGSSTTTTLSGEVRTRIEFDQYILTTDLTGVGLPSGAVEGDIGVNVTCTEAGDQEPVTIGFLTFTDDGNDFAAVLTVEYKLFERS